MDLFFIGIFILAFLYFVFDYYDENIKKFKPEKFGLDDFKNTAKFEKPEWTERAYREGITKKEWFVVNERQLTEIDKELKSRGISDISKKF